MEFTEVELVIKDTRVELWYQSRHQATIVVQDSGELTLCLHGKELTLTDQSLHLGVKKLDVYTLIKEEDQGSIVPIIPKRKELARTRVVKASRAPKPTSSSSTDSIETHSRDKVLDAILDSLLDHPEQTKSFTSAETRRIAKKYDQGVYVVAGVRANLTRGSYGDLNKVLDTRRRQRLAASRTTRRK